jgi:hypothetical protein
MTSIEKFKELYHALKESRDVADMRIFGHASKMIFEKVAEAHPELAEAWLEMLAPISCHNYLSDEEALEIAEGLVSQDGRVGPHWDFPTFEQAVLRLGGKVEDLPRYNRMALWVTANMIFSDHANSIAEDMGYPVGGTPNDKMARSCYRKSVEKLTDPDRPRFIRAYFDLD